MSKVLRTAMLIAAVAAVVSVSHSLTAFNLLNRRWPPGAIDLEIQLGPARGLTDGSASWDDCAVAAANDWNAVAGPTGVSLHPILGSTRTPGAPDMVNSVFFAEDLFGIPFDRNVLVVTQTWVFTGTDDGDDGDDGDDAIDESAESDVIFNAAQGFQCVDGPRTTLGSTPEVGGIDLHRVAGHEFGHVFGLDHPDDIGVIALMDRFIGDVRVPQADDIQGLLTLYGAPVGPGIPFPPRNQVLAFFLTLENEYRNGLMRQQNNPGFVDAEGSAVWFPEWLRYVLNGCSATEATNRVFLQIRGQDIQPVCGVIAAGTIDFPPRNLSLDFLVLLDALYRDELGRGALPSFIDLEGKAVWLQEFLRYRVNGCSDADAVARVIGQIRGEGIAPLCV
ncbi:MAG: matrixin family metalloprotease [Acidobacteria bacterium]|nr:matrixin family metalloprotease [Acidobacteriota bacterium]